MPLDLETEIARRLDASPEAVSDVLATVVERIRQQVSYYGYARVAGLGTFRGAEDCLVFEPDPTLAEHVNLKFVGLDELLVSSGPGVRDADTKEPAYGELDAFDPFERAPEQDEVEAEAAIEPEAEADLDADVEWSMAWDAEGDAEGDADVGTGEDDDFEEEPPVYTFREEESVDDVVWEEEDRPAAERDADEDTEDQAPYGDESLDDSPSVQWRPIDLRPESREDDHEEVAAAAAGAASADHDFDDAESEVNEEVAYAEEDEIGAEGAFEPEVETGAEGEFESDALDEFDEEAVVAASESETERGTRLHESLLSPTDAVRRHARASARSTGERNRSVIWLGAGVIVLVAIAAVVFFALRPDESQAPPLAEQMEPPAIPDTSASSAVDETTAAEMPPAALSEEAEAEDDDSTPLRSSEGIDPSEGGYTIIVYSESSEQQASDVAAQYRGEGFRADVLEYEDDGATHLRVGIGQFTTLTEAAETRNRLAGNELPGDAWVRRVP